MQYLMFLSVRRNRRDINLMFCGNKNPLFDYLVGLYEGDMLKEVSFTATVAFKCC